MHGEGNILELVRPVQLLHVDCRRTCILSVRLLGWEDVAVFAPDHQLNHVAIGFRSGLVARDIAAVAEDRAVIGKLGDLMHAMRDIEERQPFTAQALENGKDTLDVFGGQGRCCFIEDE